MRNVSVFTNMVLASSLLALAACSTEDPKPAAMTPTPAPAPAPAPAAKAAQAPVKAKATKLAGDVGLLDTEKNYMIVVTKDGKLVTLDFDAKTKVTKYTPRAAKVGDVGLGSAATVTYTKQGDKNIASQLEYIAKKGGE